MHNELLQTVLTPGRILIGLVDDLALVTVEKIGSKLKNLVYLVLKEVSIWIEHVGLQL